MAEEVVRIHLQGELEKAINETSKKLSQTSKLLTLDQDFKSLKRIIDASPAKQESSSEPREETSSSSSSSSTSTTLHQLKNLLSDWRKMLQDPRSIHDPRVLCAAYKLHERLKKIKKELQDKMGDDDHQHQDITDDVFPNNLKQYRWSCRYQPKKVYGVNDKITLMKRLLTNEESENEDGFRSIAMVGMAGVGKTTLCQEIFNDEKVKGNYLIRLWVCLSKQPNDGADGKKEAVKRILKCLGAEDSDELADRGLRELIFALRLRLLGKKYLIVLDDAWLQDECFGNIADKEGGGSDKGFEKLAYGLPKGEGSVVMVTTRAEEIAEKMVGEENVHRVAPLKKKELCWEIFKDTVQEDGLRPFPSNLEGLRKLVVDRCVGLPLAATMMGEIMRRRLSQE